MSTKTRRRRPEARPDEILDAALSVFVEQGFTAARVEDIARRAGLSKGAVYLYFPSKEAMLKALVEQSAGALATAAERLVSVGAPRDPEAALRGVIFMMITAMTDPDISAAPRLVLTEAHRFPDIAAHYRDQVLETARRAIATLAADGVEAGTFRPVDADMLMRCIGGPCLGHMMLASAFDFHPKNLREPVDVADALSDLLLHGLKPREDA
ncbi:TetR/AcrR family transcriptional regulator [Maricaulis virginensis]|uniref:TetR family transcriptional regulator n=1 Tax=Maricaulis virginensis TaxID=144022 RepID=A0A9W6ILF2_9PROT|nr:TetR/AcrR family transcriptional regulator [Maricaulis virginensis]GLK51240.1 TetR family transcriptional regulator [Maricaulis virginensis]